MTDYPSWTQANLPEKGIFKNGGMLSCSLKRLAILIISRGKMMSLIVTMTVMAIATIHRGGTDMASKELIALAAKAMEDRRKDLIAQPLSRIYPQLAEAAAGAILAEQIEHIEAEVDGYIENFRTMHRINGVHVTRALATLKRRLIDESPLGEQSE
ncbi:hypothetical protein ABE530_04005 [Brucella sp. TWI559]